RNEPSPMSQNAHDVRSGFMRCARARRQPVSPISSTLPDHLARDFASIGTFAGTRRFGRMRPLRDPLFLLLFATAAATAFFAVIIAM
ncbi:MAG TPA: hypothetical protein VJ740_13410, partial [Hyphomicrobiaceae bacterium]|nr:hypothetical protein [Hyphomicrobiaceae bacterium]